MLSSISPRASSDRRRGAVLWAGVIAAPLVWLSLLQTNYLLAYPTCADRSNTWLHVASAVALAVMVLLSVGAAYMGRTDSAHRAGAVRFDQQRDPIDEDRTRASRHFLAVLGIFMTALCLLLVIGTWIPTMVLHPCD
jgi:hypothetical protein